MFSFVFITVRTAMITGFKKSSENHKERNIMGGVAWTEEEDDLLRKCIEQYGEGKWHRVPLLAGLNRCRKSCRLRWLNYLRPNIKRGKFTDEEVKLIIKLHNLLGNRWSLIAGQLRGRTANDVKNFWNCHLSKTFENPHQDHTTATSSNKEEKQQTADTPENSSTSGNGFEELMISSLSSFPEKKKKKKTTKFPSSFNGSESTAGARSQATSNVPITAHGHQYEYGGLLDNQHVCICKDNQGVVLASSSLDVDNVCNVAIPYPSYNRYATDREDCDCTDINNMGYYTDDQGNKEENHGSKYHRGAISPEEDELAVNFEFDEIKMCGEQRKISKWDLDDLMIMEMDLWGNQALL